MVSSDGRLNITAGGLCCRSCADGRGLPAPPQPANPGLTSGHGGAVETAKAPCGFAFLNLAAPETETSQNAPAGISESPTGHRGTVARKPGSTPIYSPKLHRNRCATFAGFFDGNLRCPQPLERPVSVFQIRLCSVGFHRLCTPRFPKFHSKISYGKTFSEPSHVCFH